MWGSVFKPGRAYRNYVSHLKKACFLAELPLAWYTPAVIGIPRGLKAARNTSFRFPNLLYTADLSLIIDELGWEGEFSQLRFIPFLFPLRIPSGALVMRRAFPEGIISERVAQKERALIGVRKFHSLDALIVKMTARKNLTCGCILKRPCLCQDGNPQASKI